MNDIETLEYIINNSGTCPINIKCENCVMNKFLKRERKILDEGVCCKFGDRIDGAKKILIKIKIQELQKLLQ